MVELFARFNHRPGSRRGEGNDRARCKTMQGDGVTLLATASHQIVQQVPSLSKETTEYHQTGSWKKMS